MLDPLLIYSSALVTIVDAHSITDKILHLALTTPFTPNKEIEDVRPTLDSLDRIACHAIPQILATLERRPFTGTHFDISPNNECPAREQMIVEFDDSFTNAAQAAVNKVVDLEHHLRNFFPPTAPQIHNAIIKLQSWMFTFIPHLRAVVTRKPISSQLLHHLVRSDLPDDDEFSGQVSPALSDDIERPHDPSSVGLWLNNLPVPSHTSKNVDSDSETLRSEDSETDTEMETDANDGSDVGSDNGSDAGSDTNSRCVDSPILIIDLTEDD
ncbi:hypothetical protein BDP27DRAFT_1418134 [Rhodocollybia butyracea]|uniref:Uncharacterized protein n=1 Tax=Rhodocollybia butyracea TaxID=206335 RepID=A0A9P5Q0P1_9AGAR|nr:hypothetical protein BDP27DRAFT_1418134 [Rhodocollybia butyracea]